MSLEHGCQVPHIMAVYCKSEISIPVNLFSTKRLRKEKLDTFHMPKNFGIVAVPMDTESEASWQPFLKNKTKNK